MSETFLKKHVIAFQLISFPYFRWKGSRSLSRSLPHLYCVILALALTFVVDKTILMEMDILRRRQIKPKKNKRKEKM